MTGLDDTARGRGIRRRSVAKGAAWAVPAIAVGTSAPAHAASGLPPTVLVGVPCKLPGASLARCPAEVSQGILAGDFSKAFAFPVQVTNNTNSQLVLRPSITISNVRDGDGNPTLPFTVEGIYPDYCMPVFPGQSVNVIVYANSDNSANDDIYADLTVPWGHDCADPDHPPIFVPDIYAPAFPPCSSNIPFPTGSPSCTPPFYQA